MSFMHLQLALAYQPALFIVGRAIPTTTLLLPNG